MCAGYQIVGKSFPGADGTLHEGVGLLDVATAKGTGPRAVGEVVGEPGDDAPGALPTLTGFENHGGQTTLGPGVRPLARVIHGVGNGDGSGTEGAVAGRVIGTYLHGPVLARNPALADLLLRWALEGDKDHAPADGDGDARCGCGCGCGCVAVVQARRSMTARPMPSARSGSPRPWAANAVGPGDAGADARDEPACTDAGSGDDGGNVGRPDGAGSGPVDGRGDDSDHARPARRRPDDPTTPTTSAPAGTGHPVLAPMNGSYVIHLTFDGLHRDYRIHVPPRRRRGSPCPW